MTPKQMGRLGLFHIEEAILEVLSEAPEGLSPADISRAIGIYGHKDADLALTYAIAHGALIELQQKGAVEKLGKSCWRLCRLKGPE